MIIKEFDTDVAYAVILDVGEDIDIETEQYAGLIIHVLSDQKNFEVIKNRYGSCVPALPLFLIDDYLAHYANKFEYRSPLLDNLTLVAPAAVVKDNKQDFMEMFNYLNTVIHK